MTDQTVFVSLNKLFLLDSGGEPDAESYDHLHEE